MVDVVYNSYFPSYCRGRTKANPYLRNTLKKKERRQSSYSLGPFITSPFSFIYIFGLCMSRYCTRFRISYFLSLKPDLLSPKNPAVIELVVTRARARILHNILSLFFEGETVSFEEPIRGFTGGQPSSYTGPLGGRAFARVPESVAVGSGSFGFIAWPSWRMDPGSQLEEESPRNPTPSISPRAELLLWHNGGCADTRS